jgi:tetratricopeptide (TPR) repeat protein
MKRIRHASIALAIGLLASASLAAAQADDRLAQGIKAHNSGLAGDEASIGEALRLLGPDGWDRPPLALAYHGSAITLQASLAKKEGDLMKALTRIDEGTKEIDAALALDPGDSGLRILRMENSVALIEASPVDRRPQAVGDRAWLRARWAELKPEDRSLVELDSGRLSLADRRLGEAMAYWRKAIREAPGSEAASRAKKLLERYGD